MLTPLKIIQDLEISRVVLIEMIPIETVCRVGSLKEFIAKKLIITIKRVKIFQNKKTVTISLRREERNQKPLSKKTRWV